MEHIQTLSPTWLVLEPALRESGLSCIDGRREWCGFGAPGGNVGEAILLLSVAEWFRSSIYADNEINVFIDRLANQLGNFRLHTDEASIARLASEFDMSLGEVRQALTTGPPPDTRESFLAALTQSTFIGCGHLRAIREQSNSYRVRLGLLEAVIRATFVTAWHEGSPVFIDVLSGEHRETAVLVFHTSQKLEATTEVPALCSETNRFFADHVAVLRYVRHSSAELLRGLDAKLTEVDPTTFALEVERLGQRHLELTLEALAPGLPRHRVRFGVNQQITLEFSGDESEGETMSLLFETKPGGSSPSPD